ncbi:hypothetical protein VTI28DRAFT_5959 [Corynascus sepedonium]
MLVKDFRERPCKNNNSKPRTITKGAFITFARHTSDDESNTSSQSKQRSPPPRRSKSRSPTLRSSSKHRFTSGSISGCSACDNPHCLAEYWAARPEIRFKNRFTSRTAEAHAQERKARYDEGNSEAPLKCTLKRSASSPETLAQIEVFINSNNGFADTNTATPEQSSLRLYGLMSTVYTLTLFAAPSKAWTSGYVSHATRITSRRNLANAS